jgi:hypothetical protein
MTCSLLSYLSPKVGGLKVLSGGVTEKGESRYSDGLRADGPGSIPGSERFSSSLLRPDRL